MSKDLAARGRPADPAPRDRCCCVAFPDDTSHADVSRRHTFASRHSVETRIQIEAPSFFDPAKFYYSRQRAPSSNGQPRRSLTVAIAVSVYVYLFVYRSVCPLISLTFCRRPSHEGINAFSRYFSLSTGAASEVEVLVSAFAPRYIELNSRQ